MLEKYERILKEDLFLSKIKEEGLGGMILTGGAVIDILSGIIPKDYDFIHSNIIERKIKENPEFKLLYTSSTAVTYEYLGKVIQLLYKDPSDFPYTIEQSKFNVDTGKLEALAVQSFEQKLLVPNKEVYKSRRMAKNVVRRLLHWQSKGFNIHSITFASVLKTAFRNCKNGSKSDFEDEDEES